MLLSDAEIHEFLGGMFTADHVGIDTETNGEDIRDGRGYAVGISMAYGSRAIYLPFRHKYGDNLNLQEWRQPIQVALDHCRSVSFHGSKFDLVSLGTLGIVIPDTVKIYCTLVMAHMIDENLFNKSLEALCQKFLGVGKNKSDGHFDTFTKKIGWANVSSELMGPYACQDARLEYSLFKYLYPEFKKQGFDGLWETRQQFVRLLMDMESTGIRIDTDLCASQASSGRIIMSSVADELGFNPGSTKQLGQYLLNELNLPVVKKTPKGQPCFDKDAMEIYDTLLEDLGNPNARLLLRYRGWQKAVSACYESYIDLLSPDGRLRPNYKIHGTVTGRLSCEKPNLQQIPKSSDKEWNGAVKRAFIPRPGYKLYEADYSQLELRLGASYAQEHSLISEFANPDSDVFTRMASELGMSRGDTKTLTYSIQYGAGVNRIKNVFKVDEAEARAIRDNYFNTYPGFAAITQFAARKAESKGYVKTWSGRRRHFMFPKTESFKAFNSVVQGGAADIVERTMLRLNATGCNVPDCRMLLQVHDSIVFEISEHAVNDFEPMIIKAMEDVEPDFGVKFAVDFHEWVKEDENAGSTSNAAGNH